MYIGMYGTYIGMYNYTELFNVVPHLDFYSQAGFPLSLTLQFLVWCSIMLAATWSTDLTSKTQLMLFQCMECGVCTYIFALTISYYIPHLVFPLVNILSIHSFAPFAYNLSSGLWSLLAVAIFQFGHSADCNLHATFEGLCYCILRLPPLVSRYISITGPSILLTDLNNLGRASLCKALNVTGSNINFYNAITIPVHVDDSVWSMHSSYTPSATNYPVVVNNSWPI